MKNKVGLVLFLLSTFYTFADPKIYVVNETDYPIKFRVKESDKNWQEFHDLDVGKFEEINNQTEELEWLENGDRYIERITDIIKKDYFYYDKDRFYFFIKPEGYWRSMQSYGSGSFNYSTSGRAFSVTGFRP